MHYFSILMYQKCVKNACGRVTFDGKMLVIDPYFVTLIVCIGVSIPPPQKHHPPLFCQNSSPSFPATPF